MRPMVMLAATSGLVATFVSQAAPQRAEVSVSPLWTDVAPPVINGSFRGNLERTSARFLAVAQPTDAPRRLEVLRLAPDTASYAQRGGAAPMWAATVYDYSTERPYLFRLNAEGTVSNTQLLSRQPAPSRDELRRAVEILRSTPAYASHLTTGAAIPYAAMPGAATEGGRRTIYVGLRPGNSTFVHRIVGVRLGDGSVTAYEGDGRAPASARAEDELCGLPSEDCEAGTPGSPAYRVQWPSASSPIWDFTVVRPSGTATSETPDGAGVEIRDVRYNGQLVLLVGHVPVLNVKYDGDTCGPYRDWLHHEGCFKTSGTTAQPGFHVSNSPIGTICETRTDAGDGRGVGIENSADYVTVVSEMEAAWYRYLNGWRLHRDGSIDAIFQYAGTVNSCMCNKRTHHAYWRLDWALGANNPSDAIENTVERQTNGGQWAAVPTEMTAFREPQTAFRVRQGALAYTLAPGAGDGSARNDTFAQSDLWFLRWNPGETTDLQGFGQQIDLAAFVNAEPLSPGHVVTWYAAHLRQDGNTPGSGSVCTTVGPRLTRTVP